MSAVKHSETVQVAGSALPLELGADGAPQKWVRLIPPGTFATNDGRGPFANTDPVAVITASKAWLNGLEAPGDYNHATENTERTGAPAPASGWVKDWRVEGGAIEGLVEWTPKAAAAIRDKEFKYVSPVFDAAKSDGRVVRIKRFALTNTPAIDQLPAIAASRTTNQENTEVSKLIAQALGLSEAATEAEMVTAATNLRANYVSIAAAASLKGDASVETIIASLREKPDAAKWIAAAEYQRVTTELTTVTAARDELQKKVSGNEVETVFAEGLKAGKLIAGQKDYWTNVCASAGSAKPLKDFLASAVVIVKPGEQRELNKQPGDTDTVTITAAQLNAAEKEHCRKHGLNEESYARELTKVVAAGGSRPLAA